MNNLLLAATLAIPSHDIPEDIPTVDVDRLELLNTYSVENDPTIKPTVKPCQSYALIWNFRRIIAGVESDFICDHYVQGIKVPTFRAGLHHVFMHDKDGMMYRVRSKYLRESWTRTGGGAGGDPEMLNRQRYPSVERQGIIKIPPKR